MHSIGRAVAILILVAIAAVPPAAAAQAPISWGPPVQSPIVTPLPWLLPENAVESAFGLSVLFDEPPPFTQGAGTRPRVTRRTLFAEASAGLGDRVEGSARIGLQSVEGDLGEETAVPTDLALGIGYAFTGRFDSPRAFAARLSVKVPTAPDRSGAGTDEADVGFALSAGARARRAGLFGSLGLLLLGNPLRPGAQDDVATYGGGIWIHADRGWDLTAEIEGQAFSRFGNSGGTVRIGARTAPPRSAWRSLSWHAALMRALNEDAPRWGLVVGATLLSP